MKFSIALVALFCLFLIATPSRSQTLYDNGPVDGQDLGWTINFGFSVSDSFTLGSAATVPGASFWAWLIPGDTLTSVEFQIGASAFGNELMDQTLNVTASNCFSNQFGYNVCDETATFNGGGVALGASTYWMTLSNASVPSGDPAYWDHELRPVVGAGKHSRNDSFRIVFAVGLWWRAEFSRLRPAQHSRTNQLAAVRVRHRGTGGDVAAEDPSLTAKVASRRSMKTVSSDSLRVRSGEFFSSR